MFSELVGGIRLLLLFALQVNRDVLMAGLSHLLPSGSQIVTLNLSNVDVARSQGLDELAMQKAWWGDWGTWGANRWASLVDMHLAATSRVVVGTYGSTFSELVGALNVDATRLSRHLDSRRRPVSKNPCGSFDPTQMIARVRIQIGLCHDSSLAHATMTPSHTRRAVRAAPLSIIKEAGIIESTQTVVAAMTE